MIRATGMCLLAVWLLVYGSAAGEDPVPDQPEPPVRLKRKAKSEPVPEKKAPTEPAAEKKPAQDRAPEKKPEPPRKEEAKDTPDPEAQDLERELQQLAARVEKNMRTSEDRLAQNDPGIGTQQVQRDIVKDLEAFIELTKRQQQQQQRQQLEQQQGRGQRSARQRSAGPQRAQQEQRREQEDPQAGANPGGGRGGREGMNKIADLYKDVWGHLPETLRQEMNQYAREQFMDKYSELLKQYYATIAEKSRRKGD